jgi:outer membrane protein
MLMNTHILKRCTLIICFLAIGSVQAQTKTIAFVKDNELPFTNELELKLREEINTLLLSHFEINYQSFSGEDNEQLIQQNLASVYTATSIDLVIAVGLKSSKIMHSKTEYKTPSIATMVLEEISKEKIGVTNYAFFNLSKTILESVKYFSDLYQLKSIGVLIDEPLLLNNLTGLNDGPYTIETLSTNVVQINDQIEGVVILGPMFHSNEKASSTIDEANSKRIPSFSLYNHYLSFGCTGSMDNFFTPFIKRTAIQSLRFLEKLSNTDFQSKDSFQIRLVLNMESIRTIQKLPQLEYFEDAILINVSKNREANLLSFSAAIALGLKEKISVKMKNLEEQNADQDLKQAKGNLGPKLSIGAQSTWLSNNLVEASLGQKGQLTVAGSLNLQQVLFSESILANIAIKKLLIESAATESRQEILDAVVSISYAYVSVLLAQSNLILQNENLNTSKLNLSLAKNKRSLGVGRASDVNRWISELNENRIQLSNAQASYKKSIYALNETLNQPIATAYTFPSEFSAEEQFKFPEELLSPYLKNEFLTELLADFYLQETKLMAPEYQRMLLSEQILERKMKSARRQLFMPELVGFANASDTWLLDGVQANSQLPVPPPPQDLTWNAGIGVRIPIFNNRVRKTGLAKAILEKEKVFYSEQELSNAMETNIRSQIQELRSLFVSSGYAEKAAIAANDNYKELEDAYHEGFIKIQQLIEAQTLKFKSDLMVEKTNYEIALTYLKLERLTGTIQILKPASEQKEYFTRLKHHLLNAR